MQERMKIKNAAVGSATRNTADVWRVRIGKLAKEVLWACGAWLLGQAPMLFDTYPLGFAFLCASGSHTLSILLGLIASAFWQMQEPIIYVCAYSAAALVRIITALIFDVPVRRKKMAGELLERVETASGQETRYGRLRRKWKEDNASERQNAIREAFSELFTESVCLRMASGAVCVFIVALYRIIEGGFRYYDLFAAVFAVLLTPIAVMVYSVFLSNQTEFLPMKRVSQAALLFSLVWSADGIAVSGFPLSVLLALFFTFYACATQGLASGCVAGILCGVAHAPIQAPAFLFAALVYTFAKRLKKEGGAVLLGCLAYLIWSAYVMGISSLMLLVPTALIGGTAFSLFMKLRHYQASVEAVPDDSSLRMRMEQNCYKDSNDRFRGISEAFSSLSEMFYNLSDRFRRPGTLDLRRICDGAFDSFCQDCPNKTMCWGLEYSATLNTVNGLISALHTKGKVARGQVPSALVHRCESIDAILEEINRECAKLTGEMLRNNRTEIFAMDYESAAHIINDALEEDAGEYRFDPELEQKVREYLSDAGIKAHSVTVYGNRRRQILVRGVDIEHAKVSMDTLRWDLGELCGLKLNRPLFEVEDQVSTMTLQAKKKISVVGAQNNISADGGISGDTVNLFSNKKDFFYALISDGMGAGKEAALTSNLCSVFLEKMLRAGNRAGTSLRMLNNMIRSRSADSTWECSSTVDLIELDMMTARASFMKSGAAPSFVVRGSVVHRLQSGTAPIGIICALDVQSTPFDLKAGDTIVMISDGVLQDDPDADAIMEYLSQASSLTPEEIVYHICLKAAEHDKHDDCSAIAIRVQNVEESESD